MCGSIYTFLVYLLCCHISLIYLSKRTLSGPWRWFDESMLDCCEPLEKVKAEGISFGKLVCLAQCAGAEVQAFRTSQTTVDQFRQFVKKCSASDGCHVVSSYHRATFKQVEDLLMLAYID